MDVGGLDWRKWGKNPRINFGCGGDFLGPIWPHLPRPGFVDGVFSRTFLERMFRDLDPKFLLKALAVFGGCFPTIMGKTGTPPYLPAQ